MASHHEMPPFYYFSLPSPDESPSHPHIDWAVCLLSLIKNWQLQRPEVDSEKQMVFTNNIPKTGFLITPTGPISRHRRRVSLSSGASRRGQMSLPCCGPSVPCATEQRDSETPDPGLRGRSRHPLGRQALTPRKYGLLQGEGQGRELPADLRLQTEIKQDGYFVRGCVRVPKVVFCKKNLTTLYHLSNRPRNCL